MHVHGNILLSPLCSPHMQLLKFHFAFECVLAKSIYSRLTLCNPHGL